MVRAVRRFNRFYTQQIGVLGPSLLGSDFTLAEGRVLYELAHHRLPTATDLGRGLALDQGYLSRILSGFEKRGLVRRARSAADARKRHLSLTRAGRTALSRLDRAACAQVAAMLGPLAPGARKRLLGDMREIESVLAGRKPEAGECVLRSPRPGDLGWIVERHGALYAELRGWNVGFEALVARVVADFAERGESARERLWIAESGGERIGSVLLVARTKSVAQLRLLLVEPGFRGRGVGRSLLDACIAFARSGGYRKIALWTEAGLEDARRLYERAGFRLRSEKSERRYGGAFVSQTWELAL
ncbi:MAG: helix-turn-helix domain-containing GNAT family N-acetyltransferase [Planctomycetes bacterium]|nr:helix-turn-helix domain-containing GNAT family N-acetyltransferase [Planctomycetota bacterium]